MSKTKLLFDLIKSVASVSDELPKMRYHVSDTLINFHDNYLCGVLQFKGVPYEAISVQELELEFDKLNLVYTEAGREYAGRLQFNCYQLRRKITIDTDYDFKNYFTKKFANKYLENFNKKDYFENNFYMAVLMKFNDSLNEAIDELHDLMQNIKIKLARYEPEILSTYINSNDVLCSEVYEFWYELLNGEQAYGGFPVTGTPLFDSMPSSSLHFGFDLMQMKTNTKSRYAVLYDLKDFPNKSKVGMFNKATLALPFEYNLVQSFTALSPNKALHKISDQLNRMRSAEEKSEHQQIELEEAQGYVQTGELAFGAYHCALIVYGNTKEEAIQNGLYASASFSNNAGAIFRKARQSSPATFFSQFPRYKHIPRKMFKSSRNLSATYSMHTYSKGKTKGNPLGDGSAVMPLATMAGTRYDFNFHATKIDENSIGDSIAGHTLILGETGAGKTTLQASLTSFVSRFDPAMFFLDKDRGMELFVRALDGDYFAIEEGIPTGINPFQFKDSPQLRGFLNKIVVAMANDIQAGVACTSEEKNLIAQAIESVMDLPDIEEKRFSRLLEAIPNLGGNSLYQRLLKWCDGEQYGWALDNPTNKFNPDRFKIVGFEVGDILKPDYEPSEPLLACLFYLKDMLVDKYPLVMTTVEEFWLPLKYATTRAMMEDVLKAGRKRGEFMLLVTQSPEETIASPIFPTIVQQTPTKILLPNTGAKYEGGYELIGLTPKEFSELKTLSKDSRAFLIKQGLQSSFAVLNLYGYNDEIAILSGTKENVAILDELQTHFKDKVTSDVWLPLFFEILRLKKIGQISFNSDGKPELTEFMHSPFTKKHFANLSGDVYNK